MNEYEDLRKKNLVGFAEVYLCRSTCRCNKESNSDDGIDKKVYSMLVDLDTRLGTKASEQLYKCLYRTTRTDIIKVQSFVRMGDLNYFRLSTLTK